MASAMTGSWIEENSNPIPARALFKPQFEPVLTCTIVIT
jgi:hypothetical protein